MKMVVYIKLITGEDIIGVTEMDLFMRSQYLYLEMPQKINIMDNFDEEIGDVFVNYVLSNWVSFAHESLSKTYKYPINPNLIVFSSICESNMAKHYIEYLQTTHSDYDISEVDPDPVETARKKWNEFGYEVPVQTSTENTSTEKQETNPDANNVVAFDPKKYH